MQILLFIGFTLGAMIGLSIPGAGFFGFLLALGCAIAGIVTSERDAKKKAANRAKEAKIPAARESEPAKQKENKRMREERKKAEQEEEALFASFDEKNGD